MPSGLCTSIRLVKLLSKNPFSQHFSTFKIPMPSGLCTVICLVKLLSKNPFSQHTHLFGHDTGRTHYKHLKCFKKRGGAGLRQGLILASINCHLMLQGHCGLKILVCQCGLQILPSSSIFCHCGLPLGPLPSSFSCCLSSKGCCCALSLIIACECNMII
jgi:hypothetical protein